MADFKDINNKAMDTVKDLVHKKPLSVISINSNTSGWTALVEALEREAVPDTQNLIGIYEVTFSKGKEVTGYKRKEVRRKSDTGLDEEKEE
ncbi:MAG: gas vesicle protein [Nanoarchaeota archaeon]|nr:gas vesicle protein [Nanoarchaeota archaeon]